MKRPTAILAVAAMLGAAACGTEKPTRPAEPAQPVAAATPAPAPTATDMSLLRSEAVKDAIHRALTTGQNQRWQDGKLSGYAVPSLTTLPNGCRTVRYTVDQRPEAPMMTINACEGSR